MAQQPDLCFRNSDSTRLNDCFLLRQRFRLMTSRTVGVLSRRNIGCKSTCSEASII